MIGMTIREIIRRVPSKLIKLISRSKIRGPFIGKIIDITIKGISKSIPAIKCFPPTSPIANTLTTIPLSPFNKRTHTMATKSNNFEMIRMSV